MKLDWDYIRELLICVEEERNLFVDVPKPPKWTDQTEAQYQQEMQDYQSKAGRMFGHLELLVENGYLDGLFLQRSLDGFFSYGVNSPRLTMRGHELLAQLRSKPVWDRVKEMASRTGVELTFDAIKEMGKIALKQVLGQ